MRSRSASTGPASAPAWPTPSVEVAIAGVPVEQQVMVRVSPHRQPCTSSSCCRCAKTFALDAVREAYQASGHRVVGVALAARAARELHAGAGIDARTARSFQLALDTGRDSLDARTVLVIDEAAMLGTRLFADLIVQADRVGAKVIAVGDPKQLPAIEAGGLFSALLRRADAVSLAGNCRQPHLAEAGASGPWGSARQQPPGTLECSGNITVAQFHLLRDALVDDWYQAHSVGRQAVMGALRRSDIADLNERARARSETTAGSARTSSASTSGPSPSATGS